MRRSLIACSGIPLYRDGRPVQRVDGPERPEREGGMKALAFHEHGGLDRLRYQDVPDPAIGPADVLVRVRACALNHLDLFVREGLPGFRLPLPFWTGCDIAGEVAQVGAAVADVTVGDRV